MEKGKPAMSNLALYCSQCGAPLEADNQFCGECGKPIGPVPPPTEPATAQSVSKEEPAGNKGKPKNPVKSLIISITVVLILGLGAWAGYKGYQRTASGPQAIDAPQEAPQAQPIPQQKDGNALAELRQTIPDPSGRIVPGWIGVNTRDVQRDLAKPIGMATPSGVEINACEPGGPAERSGLLPGDVILQMNGVQIVSAADLKERVSYEPPGQTIRFTVWRNGTVYAASVVVAERPPNLDEQKRSEAKRYADSYVNCFSKFCPGCNDPLNLFQEQTPDCRRCGEVNGGLIHRCAETRGP
jgi:hypothetical protein